MFFCPISESSPTPQKNTEKGRLCEGLDARDGNSVIRRASLPAGVYTIRVRGWGHGEFQLGLRCWDGAAPTVADVLAAAPVLGCDQTVTSETPEDSNGGLDALLQIRSACMCASGSIGSGPPPTTNRVVLEADADASFRGEHHKLSL